MVANLSAEQASATVFAVQPQPEAGMHDFKKEVDCEVEDCGKIEIFIEQEKVKKPGTMLCAHFYETSTCSIVCVCVCVREGEREREIERVRERVRERVSEREREREREREEQHTRVCA